MPTLFPSYAFPRYVAGGPLAADNIKCQLNPIDFTDYAASFSSAGRTPAAQHLSQRRMPVVEAKPDRGRAVGVIWSGAGESRLDTTK